ncbi:inhibitor of nuclear factor kappa-B kinase subunit alpha-like isoform X2 [Anoplopoma fimbria]|uniref:inhibitor of nuclear factor kappa-B kinase subunit alpha-like isoform X2 n=1 Tax=Anoplopoma fimbria TaxID=229290 RepID=UPI0023EAC6B6|nr:inhibitor of nuclear factor kappa-B kinase subunit alpha-like isoform X2 [Anoplopoma fimbria]
MERTALKQSQLCGSWEMKEKLGTGGFGHVYLYQHLELGEKIALKLCRLELNSKNKDRWGREIQIMKKLNHVNVVQAREVPEELSSIALNDLPLLAMEYCSRGDLRKVLNKPENCCGLKESEILSLLSDIGSGIQYLHENKIIHRDLKPENIVLQEIGGKLVHKIIDLGYAKDLDQGSLCTSFVGTLQYLAPELFESKPYTVTVDYWSFGTVIFECICGFRPFLHHMQPVQWPLLEPIESLLQMLLLWDAATRGGGLDPDTNKPHCYTALQNILSMKVIHVLDMTSAQLHSLVLGAEESLHSLQLRLETHTQTHISPLSQELLLETGISLDPRRPPAHCLPEGLRGWDSSIVFLFDKSLTKYSGPLTARPLPDSVNFIVRETKTQLPLSALRKVWGEAVSYICGLKEDYIRLYQGQRAAMLSLLRYNTNLTRYKNLLFSQSQQLRAKLAFFKTSIQNDLEQYTKQRHSGISSEKMLKTWQENEEKADGFAKVADVGYLDEEIVALHSEIVELQRSPFARRQGDIMEQLEEKAIELYKQLKAKCKSPDPPHGYSDSSDMVKMILQTVQNQDRVLKDLYTHLSTILVCKQRIVDLFPKLERAVENIKTAEAAVMQMQMKRQKEFWYLLKIACAQNNTPSQSLMQQPTDSETVNQLLDENQRYLSQLTSLLQDATQEMEHSVMDQDWSWTQYGAVISQPQKL